VEDNYHYNDDEVEYKIPSFNEAFDALNQIHLYLQAHKYLEKHINSIKKLKDDLLNRKISE